MCTECFADDATVRTFAPSLDKLKQKLKNYVLKIKIELELKFVISKQHNLNLHFLYIITARSYIFHITPWKDRLFKKNLKFEHKLIFKH